MRFTFFRKKSKTQSGYSPQELGFPFKEVKRIYIGGCGSYGTSHNSYIGHVPPGYELKAHAHICKNHKSYKTICVMEKYAKDHDTMYHEYAHILDTEHHENCPYHNNFTQEESHSYSFNNILKKFGQSYYFDKVAYDTISAAIGKT